LASPSFLGQVVDFRDQLDLWLEPVRNPADVNPSLTMPGSVPWFPTYLRASCWMRWISPPPLQRSSWVMRRVPFRPPSLADFVSQRGGGYHFKSEAVFRRRGLLRARRSMPTVRLFAQVSARLQDSGQCRRCGALSHRTPIICPESRIELDAVDGHVNVALVMVVMPLCTPQRDRWMSTHLAVVQATRCNRSDHPQSMEADVSRTSRPGRVLFDHVLTLRSSRAMVL